MARLGPLKDSAFRRRSPSQVARRGTTVGGRLEAGYNPSVYANPTNPNRWANIDFIVETTKGTGNRIHTRSMSMCNVFDPAELIIRRAEASTSPDGYGPNGDGTGLEGTREGNTIGFIASQGMIPQGSFQGFSSRIGFSTAEDTRQNNLTVQLAAQVTLPQATIDITGDMDSVTAPDGGANLAFRREGRVTIAGQQVIYAHRSATRLFGCTGGTGTIASGTNVVQTQTLSGGKLTFRTARVGTPDNGARIVIDHDGALALGERAANDINNQQTYFHFVGGQTRLDVVPDISNLQATVIGTPGSKTITWYVVGNTARGGQTKAVSVTIANAPTTLDVDNYVKLTWDAGPGVVTWDIVREATDGSPAAVGPIILGQPHLGQGGSGGGAVIPKNAAAVDRGQSVVGINEEQSFQITNVTSGQFKMIFNGETTTAIDLEASAATVQAALEGLASVAPGDVSVAKTGVNNWRITFTGAFAATDVSMLAPDAFTLENADIDGAPQPPPTFTIRERVKGGPATYTKTTRNSTADVTLEGRLIQQQGLQIKRTTTATDYTATDADHYIGVTNTTASRTITLPSAAATGEGFVLIIKDESGNIESNNTIIAINRAGADTIDGLTTVSIDYNFQWITLMSTGSAWRTISKGGGPEFIQSNRAAPGPIFNGSVTDDDNVRIQLRANTNGGAIQLGSGAVAPDVVLSRDAADQLTLANGDSFLIGTGTNAGGNFIQFFEQTADPAAGATNTARLFAKDNGAGKTQLVVRFPTGATQVIATEP